MPSVYDLLLKTPPQRHEDQVIDTDKKLGESFKEVESIQGTFISTTDTYMVSNLQRLHLQLKLIKKSKELKERVDDKLGDCGLYKKLLTRVGVSRKRVSSDYGSCTTQNHHSPLPISVAEDNAKTMVAGIPAISQFT
nr:hypothetical protein HmN_000998700 [Hymenolepis microstoma]